MLLQFDKQKLFTIQGIKNTKQRNIVFDILEQYTTPVSAEQIFQKLTDTEPTINLSTVYRVLELFVNKGLVLKSNIIGTSSAGYKLNRREHKHQLICLKCNKVVPIDECPLRKLEESMKEQTNFAITGHNLEIFGYCPNCKDCD